MFRLFILDERHALSRTLACKRPCRHPASTASRDSRRRSPLIRSSLPPSSSYPSWLGLSLLLERAPIDSRGTCHQLALTRMLATCKCCANSKPPPVDHFTALLLRPYSNSSDPNPLHYRVMQEGRKRRSGRKFLWKTSLVCICMLLPSASLVRPSPTFWNA